MQKALLRSIAQCDNCSWEKESPRCGRSGSAHAKKFGHKVTIESTYSYSVGEFKVDENQSTVFDALCTAPK